MYKAASGWALLAVLGWTTTIPALADEVQIQDRILETVGSVDFHPCDLEAQGRARRVECATLAVPEDYDAPNGPTVDLLITRLKADTANPRPDPFLAIAGGPGQAASESFLFLDRVFDELDDERTFYLVDQRGTGHSGRQSCDFPDEEQLMLEYDAEVTRQTARECLEQFDGDPRQYTTSVAIRDLEQVRRALAVPQWNLMGVSYGTRVVQHYMRQYPESVRTAVLDSVVYPALNLGPGIAIESQAALDAFFLRCRETPNCADRYPQLESQFEALLNALTERPRSVTHENMHTGRQITRELTAAHVIGLVRFSLYHTDQTALLPPIIYEAHANDNFAPLARRAFELIRQSSQALAIGMHNAVVCTEDVPLIQPDRIDQQPVEATYMGDLVLNALQDTCSVWPQGVIDPNFKQPLYSDIPTLLFSGEWDPITPPAYAEKAMRNMSNARHFVLPGQGHSVSVLGCAPTLVAQFIQSASPAELDGTCLQRLRATPAFIDFNGPAQTRKRDD
ncbi:alpha/beta hydrolase [Saccharospirillum salsuginis]|uniref:Alpha/beta hydrolase n=1 Tax=Saccharospirillum salsuginis TaxID=418750 RepID=A0A918K0Y9_9GAMM|nr:alpha/beta hydrolase [Saccharospirillum salsuginis]GGX39384.1 alpha/beta hydrolase [Saccharospirillum salsuginis]